MLQALSFKLFAKMLFTKRAKNHIFPLPTTFVEI